MNTVVIEAPTKSDVRFLPNFSKRISVDTEVIDTEDLEDAMLITLIEQRLVSPSVDFSELLKALRE